MNASDLVTKHCTPCHKGMPPLSGAKIEEMLAGVPGWQAQDCEIVKSFAFANFYETMAFVNAAAWISHRENHHPDLEVGFNKCRVRYSTHSIGGLSENDFICAAKIEALTAR